MPTRLLRPSATVALGDGSGGTIKPREASVTLDAGWSPYAQADVVVPAFLDAPDLDVGADPRNADRMTVVGADAFGSRTFDLGIRSRRISADRRTISLHLASDEALLQDYITLTAIPLVWPSGAPLSLRWVVGAVLNQVLEDFTYADGPDKDVRPFWELRNLFRDPSANSITNFTTGTGASALTVSTTVGGAYGGSALRWTAAAGDSNLILGAAAKGWPQVIPGRFYNVSTYIRSSVSRNADIVLRWYDAQGALIKTEAGVADVTPTGNWNTRITASGKAPAGATYLSPVVRTTGNTAGQFHYIDGIQITEGEHTEPFFYGNSPTDAYYSYAWEGDTSDSTSIRVPVIERSPDLLVWRVGQSAWDYVTGITESAGMRLYCDEARTWRLVDPAAYTAPGALSISADTSPRSEDIITRDGDALWATGAAVHYVWNDADRGPQERWDVAGLPDKVVVYEKRTAYPGPGAANAILQALNLKGRVQVATTFTEYSTSPGQELHILLPGVPETVGRVGAVRFDLITGLMSITSKGLGEIPAGSIDLLVGTIDALPGTIDAL